MAIACKLPFGLNKCEFLQLNSLAHDTSDVALEVFSPVQSGQKCGTRIRDFGLQLCRAQGHAAEVGRRPQMGKEDAH
jgi:hypothetical protein